MSTLESVPQLSVVVGITGASHGVDDCLAALTRACEGVASEIIVVDASRSAAAACARGSFPGLTVLAAHPDTLMPRLWAAGYRHSRGKIVAFTTLNCTVPPGWTHAIQSGLAAGNVGVGGALRIAPGASATDWAIFHIRYSAFLGVADAPAVVADIPGDNAAYRRDALDLFAHTFSDGFWEVDFHRRLRPGGGQLALLPAMAVTFGRSGPLLQLAAQRFRHGRHSGGWRVDTGVRRAWQIAIAAPAIPAILLLRTVRALKRSGGTVRFGAVPAFLVLAAAWAAGEVAGAFSKRSG